MNKHRYFSVKDYIDNCVSFEATGNYDKSINTSVTVVGTCGRSHHYESVCGNKQYNKKQFSSQKKKPLQNTYKPKFQSVDVPESSQEYYFCYNVNVKHRKTLPKNDPHAIKQSKWVNVKKNGDELVKLKFEGTNLGALATIDIGADDSVMLVRIHSYILII